MAAIVDVVIVGRVIIIVNRSHESIYKSNTTNLNKIKSDIFSYRKIGRFITVWEQQRKVYCRYRNRQNPARRVNKEYRSLQDFFFKWIWDDRELLVSLPLEPQIDRYTGG